MFDFLSKDKPVKIRFYFENQQQNRKRLTWDDLNTVEMMREGEVSARGLMALAARFMADEKNNYLPHEKAMKILGGLNNEDIQSVLKQFTEGMEQAAVPNMNGSASNLTPKAGSEGTLPAGSQP